MVENQSNLSHQPLKHQAIKIVKRTATGMFLLFVLIAPVLLTYSWLQLEMSQVRRAVKWQILKRADKTELRLLKFSISESQNNLDWKHDHEFEWREKMYDIVQFENRGDSIYYWCFVDEEETDINQKIATFLQDVWQENPNKKKQEKQLDTFFKSLFISTTDKYCGFVFPVRVYSEYGFKNSINGSGDRPLTPPPRDII